MSLVWVGCQKKAPEAALMSAGDYAHFFARTIITEPKDQNRWMEKVALAYATEREDFDRAIEIAREIQDWRRCTALAEIAKIRFEKTLDPGPSKPLLVEARNWIESYERNWWTDRGHGTIASAYSKMGMAEEYYRQMDKVGDREERFRAEIDAISIIVRNKGFNLAMDALNQVEGKDLHEAEAKALGYLEIFQHQDVADSTENRRKALDAAFDAGTQIPNLAKFRVLFKAIDGYIELGEIEVAREKIRIVEAFVRELEGSMKYWVQYLSQLAVRKYQSGDKVEALKDLDRALYELSEEIRTGKKYIRIIDHPLSHAQIAWGLLQCEQYAKGWETYGVALARTHVLVNIRPRHLAAVDVALEMITVPEPWPPSVHLQFQALMARFEEHKFNYPRFLTFEEIQKRPSYMKNINVQTSKTPEQEEQGENKPDAVPEESEQAED